ncbi:MAG: UDP-N-acetylglucosamine 4,6-dehydratase (inverting) [Thermodesulfobacteriota bacterium]
MKKPRPTCDFRIFNEKSILVTGGTGSFGKAFVAMVLQEAKPTRLIVFSRDELKQYEMDQEFLDHPRREALRFFIGDVRDAKRLEMAFRGVDYVIHAAAMKQVPTAEYNPFECIHTNVLGAENVVRAAIRTGVKKVVALSTDKAASPLNLYGASKLASDKIFVAANHLSGSDEVRFAVVRYGNVIGSRGSVVPLFQRLIDQGADALPITDDRMTRFWITIEQGVQFVVSSLAMMRGGEIFVPKIPSMRITDLARAMAPSMRQKIVGIRPGEKLHEVMITEDDARNTIELSDRYVIEPQFAFWSRERYEIEGCKPVSEGFSYSSGNNTEWLSGEDFLGYLRGEH